jgi:hypothetical protein
MAWVAPAVGAVAGLIGGNDAADTAASAQRDATGVARDQLGFDKQRYDRNMEMQDPLERQMTADALATGPTSYFAGEKAQFEGGISKARQTISGQTGIGTGMQAEQAGALALNEAKGLGSLQTADDARKMQLKQNMEANLEQQGGQAAGQMGQASSALSGQLGSQADYYSRMASAGMSAFSSSMGAAGNSIAQYGLGFGSTPAVSNNPGASTPATTNDSRESFL